MNGLGHAGALAAEQQDIARLEGMVEIGAGAGSGEKNKPRPFAAPPILEGGPRPVAPDRNPVEIIHSGPAECAVGHRKTGRLDDMRLDAETGAKAQNRAGVLGNVGLVEGDPHGARLSELGLILAKVVSGERLA